MHTLVAAPFSSVVVAVATAMDAPARYPIYTPTMPMLGHELAPVFQEETVLPITPAAPIRLSPAEEAQREFAVLEERNRLARELHDSVTQSLYSLTLFAEAGRRLADAGEWERVISYLGELGETSQQALKEMRLLVHQVLPLDLEQAGLVGALQQRLDAVEGRARVEAKLLVDSDLDLSPQIQASATPTVLSNSPIP